MAKTRSSAEVWLIGRGTDHLSGSHLPTNGDVLRFMMFFHTDHKLTLKEAAYNSVSRVTDLWVRARIPHQRIDSAVRKLLKLNDKYVQLKKSRKKNSARDIMNQEEFVNKLQHLFDIATSDALKTMRNEEDKEFLFKQRHDVLSCSMAGVDALQSAKEKRIVTLQQRQQNYAKKMKKKSTVEQENDHHNLHSSPDSSSSASSDNEEFTLPCERQQRRQRKQPRMNIVNDLAVAGALDRISLPDRGATYIVAAVAKALGHDVGTMTLSRSSIRRSRISNREKQAAVHHAFIHRKPLLLHWDSKLLPDITGRKETVDRIAVLVTSGGEEMLLGIPKICRGSGKNLADACLATLDDWDIRQQIRGLLFDTTASNTGLKKGACSFLEFSLGQDLAWVACRHHVMELVLASVFRVLFGPTGGPDILIFKRFQQAWPHLNQSTYQIASDDMFDSHTAVRRAEMLKFTKSALEDSQPREDYKEFIMLCLIFLGGGDSKNVSFRAPGAYHLARWMAKAIYCLKLFMFQSQFSMTDKEKQCVKDMALFVSLIYVRFWHEAPLGIKASLNDVQLLEALGSYPNRSVAQAATDTFNRHLWYFSEILIGLSFFDSRIESDVKKQMATNLKIPAFDDSLKRLKSPPEPLSSLGLANCVTARTATIFDILCVNGKMMAQNFLNKDPSQWQEDPSYQELNDAASTMKVVNDSAERAIALMQKYNSSLTKNEEQKQYLLRQVERHRKNYPSCAKTLFMKK